MFSLLENLNSDKTVQTYALKRMEFETIEKKGL